ncbi:MAG: glutathione S-transferase family protein [Rhizobiaceae bacterium]|nr:glutathione S-transferase family protein [Rhizobiaceae bacterium]
MTKPVLYGADYSVYVRIARMALAEKEVACERVPVDVFASEGVPSWYRNLHPFGRIPALLHGDLCLYETGAITRYIDEAFDGPALQPAEPAARGVMNQIIALLDAYGYRAMVWGIAVETVDRPKEGTDPNPAVIEQAIPVARTVLAELERLKRPGAWLLGDRLTLADLHAAPIIGYFLKAPLAAPMFAAHPGLEDWWQRISARPSFVTTQSAG